MDWKEIGPYREYVVWVKGLPDGAWEAAVVPLPTPPEAKPNHGFPPDDRVFPETFESKTAAVTAVIQYINREHERRAPQDTPCGGQRGVSLGNRRFARFSVALPVIAVAPQWHPRELQGVVRNVSAGGLMAEFALQVARGRALDLLLQPGRALVDVEAKIVWTAPSNGMIRHGCAFSDPKEESFAVGLFVGGSP